MANIYSEDSLRHSRNRSRRARIALLRRAIEELHMEAASGQHRMEDKQEVVRAALTLAEVVRKHIKEPEA